jgi:hypothetical protein
MIAAVLLGDPLIGDVAALGIAACGAVSFASVCRDITRVIRPAPRHRKHGAA